MGIDGDDLRFMPVKPCIEIEVFKIVLVGAEILEVAHVLGQDCLAMLYKAKAVLEFATERKDCGCLPETVRQGE